MIDRAGACTTAGGTAHIVFYVDAASWTYEMHWSKKIFPPRRQMSYFSSISVPLLSSISLLMSSYWETIHYQRSLEESTKFELPLRVQPMETLPIIFLLAFDIL